MSKPFPVDRAGKLQALAEMNASAPELMSLVNTVRDQFATARVTYFKAGDVEYGAASPEGIAPHIEPAKSGITPQQLEAKRKAKTASAARKRK